jgi:peroxiredoxin
LADYQAKLGDLQALDIALVAASVDPKETAGKTVNDLGLKFPVAYGLDAQAVSSATGAFFEPEKKFLHATGFLLKPDGKIQVAAYSTGPLGRLTASDVVQLVKGITKK